MEISAFGQMTNVGIKYSTFFTFHHQLVSMGSPSISLFGGWRSDTKERSEQSDNIQFWSFNEKKKGDKTRKQSDFAFTLSGGEPQIQSVNWSKEIVGLWEAPPKKNLCIFGHCPNCNLTPPNAKIRALCGTNILPKMRKFFKQQF